MNKNQIFIMLLIALYSISPVSAHAISQCEYSSPIRNSNRPIKVYLPAVPKPVGFNEITSCLSSKQIELAMNMISADPRFCVGGFPAAESQVDIQRDTLTEKTTIYVGWSPSCGY